jgi:3-dehydroquinate synthase
MDSIQQRIHVAFGFPVHFTTGVFDAGNALLTQVIGDRADRSPAPAVFVVDRGLLPGHPGIVEAIEQYCDAHRDVLILAAPVLLVPGGEQIKNDWHHVADIHRVIHRGGLCRHSYVVAVGGGAVLDVVGFAAATAHRGIRLVRIPTTVLSQDDSAVGVKNGINAYGKKNFLGTFATPFAVINDFRFLPTLEDRDWRGGISEAIKAALIRDPGFFDFIEQHAAALKNRDLPLMQEVVRRSAALHLDHIAKGGDPFELGSSRPLDYGHWSAHKLEALTDYRMRHGEAVGIGIALDTTYAHLTGALGEADWRRVLDVLRAVGLAIYTPELSQHLEYPDHPRSVLTGLREFREHLGGELTILLLRGIGRPFDCHDIDTGVMIRSIDLLRREAAAHVERPVFRPAD